MAVPGPDLAVPGLEVVGLRVKSAGASWSDPPGSNHALPTGDRAADLRPLAPTDVENLFELDTDPGVLRYLTAASAPTLEQVRSEVLPRMLGYDEREPGYGFWAAESAGGFLGWFELRPLANREPGEVELGYRLRRSAWGKGYATEGAAALVWAGFTDFGVRRVVAETMTVNTGSRRVLEKVGLRFVRTFHESWIQPVAGTEHGDVEYALTREEWADGSSVRPEFGIRVVDLPTRARDLPTRARDVPTRARDVPTRARDVPTRARDVPSRARDVPSRARDVPSRARDVPSRARDVPSRARDVPSRARDVPTRGG